MTSHPAKFSPPIIDLMSHLIREEALRKPKRLRRMRTLDPMAGVGRVHELPGKTFGVELEEEWASQHPDTIVGNALALPWRKNSFDVICVSPCYGNRLADHHDAKDGSKRHSYTHDLGRKLSPGNSGVMPFRNDPDKSVEYRWFHIRAWAEADRVLRPGALFILNASNFLAGGKEQFVVQWHMGVLCELGYTIEEAFTVPTRRLRYGANRERIDGEKVIALRAPS